MATHHLKIDGEDFRVEVGPRSGNTVRVKVNGADYAVEVASATPAVPAAPIEAPAAPVAFSQPSTPTPSAAGSGEIRAPIPGVVLSVQVSQGDRVTADQLVLVLEAMKMENNILAGVDGVVSNVAVQPQQDVSDGELLMTITPG